jgi:hypothetical protein
LDAEKELVKLLGDLNANIQILTKMTALTLGKESLFKGAETAGEQMEILEKMKLPDEIIALATGSTVNAVQIQRSRRKAKEKKTPEPKATPTEGAEKIEQ